jgi:hypothetical protein
MNRLYSFSELNPASFQCLEAKDFFKAGAGQSDIAIEPTGTWGILQGDCHVGLG